MGAQASHWPALGLSIHSSHRLGLHHLPPTDFQTLVSREWWDLAETVLARAEAQGVDFSAEVPKAVKAVKSRRGKQRRLSEKKQAKSTKATVAVEQAWAVATGSDAKSAKVKNSKKAMSSAGQVAERSLHKKEAMASAGKAAERSLHKKEVMTSAGKAAERTLYKKGKAQERVAKKKDEYSILYDGYQYRAISKNVAVDAFLPDQKSARCHRDWEPLPRGYELAPDTAELRKVLTEHTWSTHVVILSSLKGYSTFQGNGYTLGQPFGDDQEKARKRVRKGTVEYMCPWECYQIIVRKPVDDDDEEL